MNNLLYSFAIAANLIAAPAWSGEVQEEYWCVINPATSLESNMAANCYTSKALCQGAKEPGESCQKRRVHE